MSYAEVVQAIADASQDAQTLEDVVNGAPDTQVKSRLGRYIWTLATINSKIEYVLTQANVAIASIQNNAANVDSIAKSATDTINNNAANSQDLLNSKINELDSAINSAAAAGAGANGWTTDLVVENGLTQKQINAQVAVKFIKASEVGLTKWSEIKKPPYTQTEYEQAYNNGINLAKAVKAANDTGYSKVVLERGLYPMCYANLTGSSAENNITSNCLINGLTDFDIDLNGSTLFAIFDSNNRSPYDKGTVLPPYKLPGALIMFKNTTNLTVVRGFIRGDEYMRSWVSGEQNTEQTYGFNVIDNNINIQFEECEFTGFRGDGISGGPKGAQVVRFDVWYSGGVDANGNEIVETGSYRTAKVDLSGKVILRNAVQINTTGYLRSADFRNDQLAVFFYDTNGVFQSSEKCYQTEFVYLPKNCRYVQFVAYNDERTDATVSYGNWVQLASGNSDGALITRCKFYENHRGGVSNLCANTIINDCDFWDNGGNKQGFMDYSNVTRYAINFEDSYVTKLSVINCRINNHIQAILCNARHLYVTNNKIQNIKFGGVSVFGTSHSIVVDNTFDNVGILFAFVETATTKRRFAIFSNNIVRRSHFYNDISQLQNTFLSVNDNNFNKCRLYLAGNNQNLVFNNNIAKELLSRYVNVFVVRDALNANNNSVFKDNTDSSSNGWSNVSINAKLSKNNYLYLLYDVRVEKATEAGKSVTVNGVFVESSNKAWQVMTNDKRVGWESHVDTVIVDDCKLTQTQLAIGDIVTYPQMCDLSATIKNCLFDNAAYITVHRRDTTTPSAATLIISDCVFDLSNSAKLIDIPYAMIGTLNIRFINCTFKSLTAKSLAFLQGQTANATSKLINCQLINVTNTDTITTVEGRVKVTYDPPSLVTNTQQSTTVTLTGAVVGDTVSVSFSNPLQGTRMWAEVTSTNTVTVYHRNDTGAAVDLASGTLTVKTV